MRTVGNLLKHARESAGVSLQEVSESTKIKEKFLIALEESHWSTLPNFPIASGFVRSYAQKVNVDPQLALALLRRDFPQGGYNALHTPEIPVNRKIVWTPKTTIAISLFLTFVAVGGYLVHQYLSFVAPPSLRVKTENSGSEVIVSGRTSPSATLEINNRPILLDKDGSFSAQLERSELGDKVEVKATSRSGKATTKITPVTQ